MELRGPFRDPSGIATYYLRNTTAGLFGGDACRVDVTAGAGATVRVCATSATKVYASRGREASVTVRLAAEPSGTLIWGPHAAIVQAGARFRQEVTVVLAKGGRVVVAEILVLGRLARGERFAFERIDGALEVRMGDDEPAYSEAYIVSPGPNLEASMAGRAVVASVYALGVDPTRVGSRLNAFLNPSCYLAGWSELPSGAGLVVRSLADSLSEAEGIVEGVVDLVAANLACPEPPVT